MLGYTILTNRKPMKHILIIFISFLLFTSPLVVQSSKYESVSQCVLGG